MNRESNTLFPAGAFAPASGYFTPYSKDSPSALETTRPRCQVADTMSVVEPIPGKQGWLIYPIKRLFDEKNRLPVGSGEKNSSKDAARAIQR